MSVTRTAKGTATSKTSGTTLTLANVACSTGDLLVVCLAYDDVTLSSVTWGSQSLTLQTAVLGAGVRTRMAWGVIASGGTQTITATWAANITAKALAATVFSSNLSGGNLQFDQEVSNSGTGTAASTSAMSAIHGGTDSCLVAVVGTEGPSGDTAGTWSTPSTGGQRAGTTGGSAASNVTVSDAYQLAPTAGSTPALSKTGMTSRDWGAEMLAFYWAASSNFSRTAGDSVGSVSDSVSRGAMSVTRIEADSIDSLGDAIARIGTFLRREKPSD